MFSCSEGFDGPFCVETVGKGVVYCVNSWIGEEGVIAIVGFGVEEFVSFYLGRGFGMRSCGYSGYDYVGVG